MSYNEIQSGKKASIEIVVRAIFGDYAHIQIGGKIILVPLSTLKI